jgi:hypothetical protein
MATRPRSEPDPELPGWVDPLIVEIGRQIVNWLQQTSRGPSPVYLVGSLSIAGMPEDYSAMRTLVPGLTSRKSAGQMLVRWFKQEVLPAALARWPAEKDEINLYAKNVLRFRNHLSLHHPVDEAEVRGGYYSDRITFLPYTAQVLTMGLRPTNRKSEVRWPMMVPECHPILQDFPVEIQNLHVRINRLVIQTFIRTRMRPGAECYWTVLAGATGRLDFVAVPGLLSTSRNAAVSLFIDWLADNILPFALQELKDRDITRQDVSYTEAHGLLTGPDARFRKRLFWQFRPDKKDNEHKLALSVKCCV